MKKKMIFLKKGCEYKSVNISVFIFLIFYMPFVRASDEEIQTSF
jgi:hypothetical protein